MKAWPLLLLSSCGTPDRWSASTTYGRSSYDGFAAGDRDGVEGAVEVGVSGPLFPGKETSRPPAWPGPYPAPAPPTDDPGDSGGLPIEQVLLLLSGAGAMKAGEYGVRKYRGRGAADYRTDLNS